MSPSFRNALRQLTFPLFFLVSLGLTACGGSGEPFEMVTTATIIIGDAGPNPFSFLVNPIQETSQGQMTADVVNELNDRWDLTVLDLSVTLDFAGIGPVNIVLDPNFESSATVFKLNRNNQPSGINQMTLSVIIETPDQNLTYSQMSLSSNTATLALDEDLPTLDFFFQGQPKELDFSSLEILIPSELIHSTEDPQ